MSACGVAILIALVALAFWAFAFALMCVAKRADRRAPTPQRYDYDDA